MKELTLEANVDNIAVVTDFVNALLEEAGCAMKAQLQIDVAIDELFGNIARYAYASGRGEATVQVDLDRSIRQISITLIDGGTPFDPLKDAPAPDITSPLEKRPIGGLGIFLVKKTMDDVSSRHQDGKNMLTIRKKI